MAQQNLPGQASDQITSTNPNEPGIVARGYTTITVNTAEAAGFSGAKSIQLPAIVAQQNPNFMFDVYEYITGTTGGYYIMEKCPYTEHFASGQYQTYLTSTVVVRIDNNSINSSPNTLGIYCWNLTSTTRTFYYVIYSTAIAYGNLYSNPGGL